MLEKLKIWSYLRQQRRAGTISRFVERSAWIGFNQFTAAKRELGLPEVQVSGGGVLYGWDHNGEQWTLEVVSQGRPIYYKIEILRGSNATNPHIICGNIITAVGSTVAEALEQIAEATSR